MSLYKPANSPYWYLNIRHNGRRIRESTGCTDRAEAQKVHNQLQVKLWQDEPVIAGATWGQAVLAWCKVEARSESELLSLKKFGAHFPDRALSDVTAQAVDEALAFCKTAGTYMRYRAMLAAVLNLAKAQGHLKEVPKLHVRRDKKKVARKWITQAQWDKLHAELPAHLKGPARLAVLTGLRQENVLGLRWAEVHLDARAIVLEAERTKSDAALRVPLADEAAELLAAMPQVAEHVFLFRGKPIKDVKTAFIAACIRAGLGEYVDGRYQGFTWHGFRHTWATWHVMNGTPLDVLQKLGGWSDMRMVMNYAHHAPNYLASFANNVKKP